MPQIPNMMWLKIRPLAQLNLDENRSELNKRKKKGFSQTKVKQNAEKERIAI